MEEVLSIELPILNELIEAQIRYNVEVEKERKKAEENIGKTKELKSPYVSQF